MKRNSLIAGIVIANLLLVLAVVNGSIWKKQSIVDDGQMVLIELAPVDPRSLMQGDYMILNFALNRDEKLRKAMAEVPTRGTLLLAVDEKDVGKFHQFENEDADDQAVAENKIRLHYRKSRRGLQFGIESFFFQEGMADIFADAKFAELRVSSGGEAVLVGLRNEELQKLGE